MGSNMMGAPNDFEVFSRATLDDDLKRVVKRAVEAGFAVVLNRPGTKRPACTLAPTQRSKDHDCGIYHAITEPGKSDRAVTYAQDQYGERLNIGVHARKS